MPLSKDFIDGLKAAETIVTKELTSAAKELDHKLSASVKERTEVRKNTAKKILAAIRKAMRP